MAVAGRIGVLCAFYRLARSFYNGDIPFESVGRSLIGRSTGRSFRTRSSNLAIGFQKSPVRQFGTQCKDIIVFCLSIPPA